MGKQKHLRICSILGLALRRGKSLPSGVWLWLLELQARRRRAGFAHAPPTDGGFS